MLFLTKLDTVGELLVNDANVEYFTLKDPTTNSGHNLWVITAQFTSGESKDIFITRNESHADLAWESLQKHHERQICRLSDSTD